MKIRILAAILFVMLLATAQAQLDFGAKAGLTAFRLTEEQGFTETNVELGVLFGAFLRYGDDLYVQPELNYLRKATEVSLDGVVFEDEPNQRLGFTSLQLPVLLGYKVFRSADGTSSVRVMAGPVFELLLRADDNAYDLRTKDYNPATLAVEAGLGLDLWFLTFDLRYGYGLSEVLEQQENVRSRMLTLGAGIKL
ncbi:MAG TPA: porin family protein [Bacteroidales bacterium]|nr:porin family protein [Bacteroidales bacterium]HRZ76153.1 porin family protein [Bacteroidales bacterium]